MSESNGGLINGGFGPCSDLYNQFSNCVTFGAQLHQIRREGSAENCGELALDYASCLRASITHEEHKKRV